MPGSGLKTIEVWEEIDNQDAHEVSHRKSIEDHENLRRIEKCHASKENL